MLIKGWRRSEPKRRACLHHRQHHQSSTRSTAKNPHLRPPCVEAGLGISSKRGGTLPMPENWSGVRRRIHPAPVPSAALRFWRDPETLGRFFQPGVSFVWVNATPPLRTPTSPRTGPRASSGAGGIERGGQSVIGAGRTGRGITVHAIVAQGRQSWAEMALSALWDTPAEAPSQSCFG